MTSTAARHAEIARRYRWAERQRRNPVSKAALRIAELDWLFTARYGRVLPDDDAGREDIKIMAHHVAKRPVDARREIRAWLRLRAPWMHEIEAGKMITAVLARTLKWRADTLAARLNLMWAERQRLGITTIGAVDVNKAKREKRRQERARQRKARERREQGAKPRAEYEAAALSRRRPWEQLGMSRRTWYRMGKPAAGTGAATA